ncbi:sulfite exporter TauE/SafE family protein [Occallatibacter riparius]|uniref:Sulfite exporter TauE/SafE family protein n=1 Tax=Occallatibacter riparius TaxID=1002689 RepID=A0A9J7BI94_9BACT|nr:sulfite exporter TauE/SafE family protein [Occallatibacter riparius]UWZ82660.1 sulfite exporter TauE/SafE family protein [Occallatibacter riparius]
MSNASGVALCGEAVALGIASGPVCLAACGPVLVPTLLAGNRGIRPAANYLTVFLAARLTGYLLFAAIAWQLGALISISVAARLTLTAAVYTLLAVVLLWYAWSSHFAPVHACAASKLVQIGDPAPQRVAGRIAGPAALGLLTGLNLCPPFIAAGIRAAQSASMLQALAFFALFFLGTSVWFIPFTAIGCVARNEAVVTVARITMALVALYYLFLGIAFFAGVRVYGN